MHTLLAASFLLVAVGVLDDKYHVSAGVRLSIQFAAILIMYYGSGLRLENIGDPFGTGLFGLGPFSLFFTTVVSMTVINAYNLIDGADGLAGDPLTHLRYSDASHRLAATRLRHLADRHCGGRILAFGGGGYADQNLVEAWSAVVEAFAS